MRSNLTDAFFQAIDVNHQPTARYVLFVEDAYYLVDGLQTNTSDIVEFYVGRNEVVVAFPTRTKWMMIRADYLDKMTKEEMLEVVQRDLEKMVASGVVGQEIPLAVRAGKTTVSKDVLKKTRAN